MGLGKFKRDNDAFEKQLARVGGGNSAALRWLLRAESDWLLARCNGMLKGGAGAPCGADDLAQEVVARMLASTAGLRCRSRIQFRSLLARVIRHLVRDHLKRIRCQKLEAEELVVDAASRAVAGIRGESGRAFRARGALSHKEEASLILRSYCGLGMDVVAFVLNCPTVPAAARLHSRTVHKLRTEVALPQQRG